MSLNRQVAQQAADDLQRAWGGSLPPWSAFKKASQSGQVRVNKTVATEAITWPAVPTAYRVVYGYVTLWVAFLAVPVAALLWFFLNVSGWWVAASFVITWYLVKVARDGQCQGVRVGAEQDRAFYEHLAENGAFLFTPDDVPTT